jgi:hypothetical protein
MGHSGVTHHRAFECHEQEMAAINVRCLEGVDWSALKVQHINRREH